MQYCNKYTVKCNIIQSSIQKPDNLFQLSASEKINVSKKIEQCGAPIRYIFSKYVNSTVHHSKGLLTDEEILK